MRRCPLNYYHLLVSPFALLLRFNPRPARTPAQVASAYTRKPVKGMLTGPVTILNWSFPRKDISRAAQVRVLPTCALWQ